VAVKPISEWTDDDLQSHVHPYYHTKVNALAAEVLRLREEVDRQQRNTMEALAEADEYSAELDRTVIQLEKTMARETEVVVRAERAEAELGKLCPHRTSESNGSYWVCCSCGEYLRKANQ
jgi:rubrerythrin